MVASKKGSTQSIKQKEIRSNFFYSFFIFEQAENLLSQSHTHFGWAHRKTKKSIPVNSIAEWLKKMEYAERSKIGTWTKEQQGKSQRRRKKEPSNQFRRMNKATKFINECYLTFVVYLNKKYLNIVTKHLFGCGDFFFLCVRHFFHILHAIIWCSLFLPHHFRREFNFILFYAIQICFFFASLHFTSLQWKAYQQCVVVVGSLAVFSPVLLWFT